MGCFSIFPCFAKPRKNTSSYYYAADQGSGKIFDPALIKFPTQESTNLDSIHSPISRDDGEDQLISSSDRRKVSTYLDVNDSIEDVESVEDKEDGEKLGVLVQLESEKERANENGKLGFLVEVENEKERMKDDSVRVEIENENERKGESDGEKEVKTDVNENVVQSQAVSDSSVSSYISYPPMHRYHNCVINEEEDDDDDYDDDDDDDDDNDEVLEQEETSESLFSVSVNQRRISQSFLVEVDDDKEVNSPLKISASTEVITKTVGFCSNESGVNQRVDSLLDPIENLAQWRTLKTRPLPTLIHHQEKENVGLEQDLPIPLSEEPSSKVAERKGNPKTDTAVTTSLSSWLVEPEKTIASKEESQYSTGNSYTYSDGATSWKSIEDRPILGAWTIDEVKQLSARSSPRKSPSHSNPDETPIIGTVGSYWNHTGQATDSSNSCASPMGMSVKSRRNRELKASSCHSSPTKRRLERTFEKTVA